MTDVLICGAGPIGLALAIELARRDVAVRVIERDVVIPAGPRALVVKPSTLYACEQLGVLDEVMAAAVRAEVVEYSYEGRTVVAVRSPEKRWPWSINIGEDLLIPILTRRLEGLGVAVERGMELIDLEQVGGTVRARLRDRAGHEHDDEAAWIVGCDGVHSTTRERLDITFDGHDSGVHWHVLDAQVDGWPYSENYGVIYMDQIFMAIYPTRSAFRVYTISRQAKGDAWQDARDYLRDRVPTAELGPAITDNAFHCSARIASTYRKGRVLLAGDATHSMSPGSAAGLNTGLQDAVNLGWKLACVVAGHADDTLLDTFEAERREVALTMTQIGQGNDDLWTLTDPLAKSRAVRAFAVKLSNYVRGGGNGYEQIMGAYGPSPIACGDRPDVGPGPGDYLNGDLIPTCIE